MSNRGMKILRVFPRKTSMTPAGDLVAIGDPPLDLWRPDDVDEVHISVVFTWDIEEGQRLAAAWGQYYPVVKVGGPAVAGSMAPGGEFVPGLYIKHGITFTSRGCVRRCPWCLVPEMEGDLVELDEIAPGWRVQDNNFLATSLTHRQRVYAMLRDQRRAAVFAGGLDARLVTDEIANELRGLRIAEAWLAADTSTSLRVLESAVKRLSFLGLRSNRLRCYVMLAYGGESVDQARGRLGRVWEIGAMPFAQLYQPPGEKRIEYSREWRALERVWARPAVIRAMHKGGDDE